MPRKQFDLSQFDMETLRLLNASADRAVAKKRLFTPMRKAICEALEELGLDPNVQDGIYRRAVGSILGRRPKTRLKPQHMPLSLEQFATLVEERLQAMRDRGRADERAFYEALYSVGNENAERITAPKATWEREIGSILARRKQREQKRTKPPRDVQLQIFPAEAWEA